MNGRNRERWWWDVHMTMAKVFFVKQEKFRTNQPGSINSCESTTFGEATKCRTLTVSKRLTQ